MALLDETRASDAAASPVTREQVVSAYLALLGREPESEHAIQVQMAAAGSAEALLYGISQSDEFARRVSASPFYFYSAVFDAEALIRRHALAQVQPTPDFLTNFLGVKVDPRFLPSHLTGMEGQVEPTPIPANWHADIAEWAAALRAVELARETFTVAELGCGWGCWMNNTGVAARALGLDVQLIGVEGDRGHLDFARASTAANGFRPDQVRVHHGVAAAQAGLALFPRQDTPGEQYGLQPVFGASEAERQAARASGRFDELPMVPLSEIAGDRRRIDLLHIDIQGGEADFVDGSLQALGSLVAYMVIGTHSREIEGRLCATLLDAGWRLEVERPAIVGLGPSGPVVQVDGVQGWRNMGLVPDVARLS